MHRTVLLGLLAGLSLFLFNNCQRQQAKFHRSFDSYVSPVGEESFAGYMPTVTFPVIHAPRPIQTQPLSELTVSNHEQSDQPNRLRRRMITIQTMLKAPSLTVAGNVFKSGLSEKASVRDVNPATPRLATSIKRSSGEDVSLVMLLVGGVLVVLGFRTNSGFLMVAGLLAVGVSVIVALASWTSHRGNGGGKTTSSK